MSACLGHERLQKQRIPRIIEYNTAPEAICKIPSDVPNMAPFDIEAVYQFLPTDNELDLYPTYINITKTQNGNTAIKSDVCLDELDTGMDVFTWVSWIESIAKYQNDRKWIVYDLTCTQDGDLNDDPDFKRPAIPFLTHSVNLAIPLGESTYEHNVYVSSVEVELGDTIISYDVTYPPSWEPPSFDIPWEDYTPPWLCYTPPVFMLPDIPDYYFDIPKVDEVEPPYWYNEIPEWFSVDPYPPPDVTPGENKTEDYSERVCKKFDVKVTGPLRSKKHGCVVEVSVDEDRLLKILCDAFGNSKDYLGFGNFASGVMIGTACREASLDLQMLFGTYEECKNVEVTWTGNRDHITFDIIASELLGVDDSVKFLRVEPNGMCNLRVVEDFSSIGSGILTWDSNGELTTTEISGGYLAYMNGKVTWLQEDDCER